MWWFRGIRGGSCTKIDISCSIFDPEARNFTYRLVRGRGIYCSRINLLGGGEISKDPMIQGREEEEGEKEKGLK